MCGVLSKLNPLNIKHGLVNTVATTPILNKVVPIALTLAGQPELAAAAVAAENYSTGGKPIPSLLKGATSYAGNAIGSSIGNSLFPGTVGNSLGPTASNAISDAGSGITNALGSNIGNAASNVLLNKSVGSIAGGFAGNTLADDVFDKPKGQDQTAAPDPASLLPAAFSPKQDPNLQLPGSLSGLNGLDQGQQTSNLATQGVYGGGLGPQEQDYFKGLVNNQLVDSSGKAGDISSLSPIENSYLSQLGFGGYSNSTDLLGALNKWKQQAA